MTKIARTTQKIFASSASNVGQFGSAEAATFVLSNSVSTLQGLAAYVDGWSDAIISGQRLPCLEELNGLHLIETSQISYIFQEGIPEWDAGTTYYGTTGKSIVKVPNGTALFLSLTDANVGNALPTAPASNTNWQFLTDLASIGGRTKLSAAQNYYVSTTGNDSNPGTSGSPWLTPQHALNYILANVDLSVNTASVNFADGTYIGNITLGSAWVGGGPTNVILNGNSVTPSNVIITSGNASPALSLSGNGTGIQIQNLKIQNTSSGSAISIGVGASLTLGIGVIFGAAGSKHVDVENGSQFFGQNNYTISGSAAIHIQAGVNSNVSTNGATVTLTGTPAFSTAYVVANDNATIEAIGMTFTGSATGSRYAVSNNAVINTNGGGVNYFPGNAGGTGTNSGTTPYGLYL